MLNVFTLANGRLFRKRSRAHRPWRTCTPVWVDLEAPTPEEKGWIAERFGLTIPERHRRRGPRGIGALLRGRQRRAAHPLRLPDRRRQTPRNVRVAFILHGKVLFSVHGEDLPVFRLLRLRARRIPALIEDAKDVLLKLYDADAEYSRRCARRHLRQPRGGQRARAEEGDQRPRRGRGAGRDRQRGGPERPHPPQRDGHAARAQLHDASAACSTPSSSRRRARSCATSTRSTATPPSCSTRSTS